jgi:hypothetical protein
MGRRSIRAHCPRCRHQQPFIPAQARWGLHAVLTVCTFGIWGISAIAALIRKFMWPWRCEHCGWHQPDFRSPEEREEAKKKDIKDADARKSGKVRRRS